VGGLGVSLKKHKGPLFTTKKKSGPSDPFQIPLPFWPFSAAPQQHQRQPHHLSKLVEQVKKKNHFLLRQETFLPA